MSFTSLFSNAFASPGRTRQPFERRTRRRGRNTLQRLLRVEGLEQRQLLAVNVAVLDTGDDAAFAAIAAQLNDNTRGFAITATVVQPSQIDSVSELNAFDVVVIGDDGTDPSPESFTAVAPALSAWAQNNNGGIVAVGWAAFGIRGEPTEATLDAIIPVVIAGSNFSAEGEGELLDIDSSHPVTDGVADIIVAPSVLGDNFSESIAAADAGAAVLGTFPVSGQLGVVAGDIPTGSDPGRTVYLGPIYAGTSALYDTSSWRIGDPDRLLEQAVNWAANVPVEPGAPVVTTNTGSTVSRGGTDTITQAELRTTDPDTGPAGLTYTVTTPPANGTVNLSGSPTTTFTQLNIDDNLVTYVHNGSDTTSDSFTFTVSDGTNTTAPATFNITVVPVVPATTVTVDSSGNLIIEGSSEDDTVTITGVGTGTGNYIVTTQQGMGPVTTTSVTGVIGGVTVNLRGGHDHLTMNNIYVNGSINIDMEVGNDTVILGNVDVVSTKADLDVDLGANNDVLNGKRIFIGGNQILNGGDGDDELRFDGFASPFTLGTSAAGNATWNGGNDNDTVHVIFAFIVGAFTIDLGEGTDAVDIFGSAASGNVSFLGGVGSDNLRVDTNFFDASLLLDGGSNNDTIFVANGLGVDIGTVNTGGGADTVTFRNETEGRLTIDTGTGNDTVDVQASAVDQFFALLGDGDDELTVFFDLVRVSADLDGGPGSADRLLEQGNDVRGTLNIRGFELFQ